ncbi:MAG: hypothetical protein RI957_1881 [Verrucomicrobiota bacterium]|jgi:hypothetical protein
MLEGISHFTGIDDIFFARPVGTMGIVAACIGIIGLSVFLYRRSWGLRPVTRFFLAAARALVLALIVAALLEPTAVVLETQTRPRELPVMIDVSESMAMKDQRKRPSDLLEAATALGHLSPGENADAERAIQTLDAAQRQSIANASRLDLTKSALTQTSASVFQELGKNLDLSYHAFGKSQRLIRDSATLQTNDVAALEANEPGTSISESLDIAANASGSAPAGIVLFSDGVDQDSSLRSEAVLRDLGSRGIPVFTVPVGLADPDDLAIRNIVMQEVAFSGDRVPVRVQIQSSGYEKRSAKLSVLIDDRTVSQKDVLLEGGMQFEDIDFRIDLYDKAAARIAVLIEPFSDEISASNNRIDRSIRVVNEKVKVLYIEGNARWEFRYLTAILKRDPRMDVTFIASSVGPEIARNSPDHIERFPSKREDAFQYDLVILGDTDAKFFTQEELELLEELVRDRGASLLMLCGPMHAPLSYSGTPVENMLPIRFDSDGKWDKVSESVYPVLTSEGRSSMVMTMEEKTEDNDRVWSRVAPMDHLPPLLGAKPGATVLATLSDAGAGSQRYPLVAWQRYGTGKCLSIATDRLWRLRFNTGDKYHWRIWSQSIQFLTLSRLMGEHKRIRLETDRASYPLHGQTRVYAHVLDDQFEPIVQTGFEVNVVALDAGERKERISLRPDRTQPGLYEGFFSPTATGRYRLEANENDQAVSNTTEFRVIEEKTELLDTNSRRAHMEHIAERTGGTCLSLKDLPKLNTLINREPIVTTVRSERALWDHAIILLLLIGLLGSEWLLRRINDLP